MPTGPLQRIVICAEACDIRSMHSALRARLPGLRSCSQLHLATPSPCRVNAWISALAPANTQPVLPTARKLKHFGWSRRLVGRNLQFAGSQVRPMASASTAQHTHLNRLAEEESPYLLQHQHNPVSKANSVVQALRDMKADLSIDCCRSIGTPGLQRHLTRLRKKISPFSCL